ncbi:hypothetical protein IY145_13135 [Methylosinus sp. H3A]|uniref:hypothetical protein n=1 Tax=Methylosinus sp. H3A TaxID=2785786 RepID=UPI0018C23293|nr:hypothetical protein [Methylosinus sp. H3A]MBG0810325.1 hypothetical protein [Methylosinus sp. H3A]
MREWLVFASSLAVVLLGSAEAAERRSRQPQPAETVFVAPAQFCEKMCPEDFSPCDPIYFKTADSRCAQVGVGR